VRVNLKSILGIIIAVLSTVMVFFGLQLIGALHWVTNVGTYKEIELTKSQLMEEPQEDVVDLFLEILQQHNGFMLKENELYSFAFYVVIGLVLSLIASLIYNWYCVKTPNKKIKRDC
jgi:hypothetical protein|tara:strand:+ start:56 stop:406 length:351 start_codon:yes stop_codon:yes gene_type:complete